jgi:signal transduction histidine kinase
LSNRSLKEDSIIRWKLAHELRNPLAPIRFALETLKADSPPASVARAREVIDRQVRQLVLLVDDLLDVSRITANKIHLRREPLELGRLMATAVESIMPLATAANHQLDVRMPSTPIRVDGDGARLAQIFANVLNNAVKFTPRGGQIWFTAEQQSTEAVVCIRDTGIGIAPDVLPRVFDMFQQAEPILERSVGGLGIGLTLARRWSRCTRDASRSAARGWARGPRSKFVCQLRRSRPRKRPRPHRRLWRRGVTFAC